VQDEETERLVDDIGKTVSSKTETAIGYTLEALDGRSSVVRTKETNLGNLTSDLMMNAYNSVIGQVDAAFCCGGTFRSDKIHGPGPITLGDILDIFPYEDPVVVIKVTGQQLWDALENSVSEYPKQEGRFPQLAGLRIEWNPSAEPGSRLRKVHMVIHTKQGVSACLESGGRSSSPFNYEPVPLRPNQDRYKLENMVPLDLEKDYWLATRAYMADGYDGFHSLKVGAKNVLIDDEQGLIVSTLYRKFFLGLKYVNALQDTLTQKHHHDEKVQAIVASVAHKWRKKASSRPESPERPETKALRHCTTAAIRKAFSGSIRGHPECIKSESDDEDDEHHPTSDSHWVRRWASIAPTVDGRIITVDY
jgi:2',3'-cyclic-nucleotide 2'-phosphodiesterase (5'-nucleotidase family)